VCGGKSVRVAIFVARTSPASKERNCLPVCVFVGACCAILLLLYILHHPNRAAGGLAVALLVVLTGKLLYPHDDATTPSYLIMGAPASPHTLYDIN
jgi:hypothetical protein